jgi:hypothetical protein
MLALVSADPSTSAGSVHAATTTSASASGRIAVIAPVDGPTPRKRLAVDFVSRFPIPA